MGQRRVRDYSEIKVIESRGGYSVMLSLSADERRYSNRETRSVWCMDIKDVLQLICDGIGDRNRWKVVLEDGG